MKKILTIILISLIIFPNIVLAESSFPAFPMSFYGTVKVDNVNLSIGSKVLVYEGEELKGEVVLDEDGIYGYDSPTKKRLLVGEYDGSEIVFKYIVSGSNEVKGGASIVKYSGVFQTGETLEFNIDFKTSTNVSSASPSSSGGGGGASLPKKVEPVVVSEEKIEEQNKEIDEKEVLENEETNLENDISKIAENKNLEPREIQLQQILSDASSLFEGDVEKVLVNSNKVKNEKAESESEVKYTKMLTSGIVAVTNEVKKSITNFVTYGTVSTGILGAGERAGVINSYKSAFGKVPSTQTEWEDIVKIANGRWPSERSEVKENKAKEEFKVIYKREPNMEQPNDNAAVTVMTYGLRPSDRNLNSERSAIKIFKNIYNYAPTSAIDWDIVRAIAYSGAVR